MVKFSVKKPLTVLVAVIAVIVLGVVAFTGMTPDLLPNMDLPYVVIVTPCPGSNPEKTELSVTRPLEQSMATLENIENISSTSSDNMSMLFLEFTTDVNMETITVDILQNIEQVSPYWDDMVGTPYILKINPSMLPVMVAAVNMDGMDITELSTTMEQDILPKLEGIDGVASVQAVGLIEDRVNVAISDTRLLELNQKVEKAILGEFEEAEDELEDAEKQLDEAGGGLSLGGGGSMPEIDTAGIGDSVQTAADSALQSGKAEIEKQLDGLKKQLAQLKKAEEQLKPAYEGAVAALAAVEEAEAYHQQLVSMLAKYNELDARLQPFEDAIPGFRGMNDAQRQAALAAYDDADLIAAYAAWQAEWAILTAQAGAVGALDAQGQPDPVKLAQLITQAEAAVDLAYYNLQLLEAAIGMSAQQVIEAWEQIQQTKETLTLGITALEEMLKALDEGTVGLDDAMGQLEGMIPSFDFDLSGLSSLASGMMDAQLEQARAQIDAGREQLKTAKKTALKQADLTGIVTRDMISNILAAQNFSMPAGYVHDDGTDVLVSVGDNIKSVEELEGLLLIDMGLDGLEPIYLRDVADIYVSDNADETYAKIDGQDGVLLTFTKQSTYATATVSDNIREKFEELSAEYEGLGFFSMMDQGEYIYIVVNSILENLLLGALFAIIILFLFLQDIRPTFITLCSIPISVIFAIALMYFSGVTINIISLSGLAVAVGMLVDNSVVVIENIYRLRHQGASAVKAAVTGATQVAGAIASSTLTTVCVFLPIVFVEGLTRQLFTDLALTLGYSLMASLIVALTLVPAMSTGLLRNAKDKANPIFDKVMARYRKLLAFTLDHKVATLAVTVLLLVASAALVLARGFTFMPDMEMPQLTVSIEMPEESTREATIAATDEVLEGIGGIEGVETAGAMLNEGGGIMSFGMGGDGNGASIYVILDEDHQQDSAQIIAAIDALYKDRTDFEVNTSSSSGMSLDALAGSGLSIYVYGDDMDTLQETARGVADVLRGVEGTTEVDDGIGDVNPELRLTVDKNKAMAKGLTTAQVYMELQTALTLENTATTITYDDAEHDVIVISGKEEDLTPDFIRDYSFTVTDKEGEDETVWLRNLVQIEDAESKTSISRYNQRRYLTVTAAVAPEYNVTLVTNAARDALAGYELPKGFSLEFTGESESIMEAFTELFKLLGLGILLVYLVMVAQFQSLKSPFIVMFTIPLAFTGGFLALLLSGMELSVVGLIGFVMLVGIIVNNGIVLVDYVNQLREGGMDRRTALLEAGVTRMRPILMTSITTVLGLSGMALGMGLGASLMQPVAVVAIGGLVYGTLMTLFVVPVMYDVLSRKELRVIDEEDLVVTDE